MKASFNNVNIITREREIFTDCTNCCFFYKYDVCYNSELRYHDICNVWHTLSINIDDIFKL